MAERNITAECIVWVIWALGIMCLIAFAWWMMMVITR